MALKDDLKKLKMYAGATTAEEQRKFDEVLEHISTTYTSDKDKETITDFFFKEINTIKDDMEEIKILENALKDISNKLNSFSLVSYQ